MNPIELHVDPKNIGYNYPESFTFFIDIDEKNYIKNVHINDEIIKFPSNKSCLLIRDIYKYFIRRKKSCSQHILPKVNLEHCNYLKTIFEKVLIPKNIKIFSNDTTPYIGYTPHPKNDKMLLSNRINLLKLCEEFMKILYLEDRFSVDVNEEKRKIRFWYNWKY